MSQKRHKKQLPVSVIVCAHNEQSNLPICLKSLASQNYPERLTEFIIVNDRSTDQTPDIIDKQTVADKRFLGIHITDILPDFAPKKRAIDTAMKLAKGEIILLTDADGRPGPNWLSTMVSYYSEDVDMVLGYAPYITTRDTNFFQKIMALEYLSHAAVSSAGTGTGYPLTCVGTNISYRKKIYLELNGFGKYKHIISGDDDLFLTRVRESGKYKIAYAVHRESHIYNNPPTSWKNFFNQRIRYASKGFDYPGKITFSLTLYYIFYILILLGFLIGILIHGILFHSLLVFILKNIADYLFMDKAAKLLNDRRFLHLMPVAAILHIPYVILFGFLGQFKSYQWADIGHK